MNLEEYLNIQNIFSLCVKSGNVRRSSPEYDYDKVGRPVLGIITHGLPYAVGYISFTVNDCNYNFEYLLQTNRGQTYSLYISDTITNTLTLVESLSYRTSTWNGRWYPITDIKIATYYFTQLLLDFFKMYNINTNITNYMDFYSIVFQNDCDIVESNSTANINC